MNWIAELVKTGVPEEKAREFINYHKANPLIWKAFERITLEKIRDRKRVGSKGIFEKIREDVRLPQKGKVKLQNDWTPCYARVFHIKHPTHNKYFSLKPMVEREYKQADLNF